MPDPATVPKGFHPDPFAYHEVIELEIVTLTNQGQGLGRIDGWVVLVPFALPGELVRARIYRNHPNFSDADLLEVVRPSPDRIEPRCRLFSECGGCQYQNLRYETQLAWKKRQVEELLEHLAGVHFAVNDVIPSPLPFHYRSKITPHFQRPKGGKIDAIGFLRAGQRHRIVDVPQCPIASESINESLPPLRAEIHAGAAGYKKGATLLLRDSENGVLTNPNEIADERVGDLTFQFAAGEFFQNNPSILPAFTGYAADQAAADGARFLVDAYCGSGLFCLTAASRFEEAVGIEVSESSVSWAKANAEQNGVTNATFQCGKADAIFDGIGFAPDETAVIIDPPRKGCDEKFLNQLLAFAPRTAVYISCNPATQMRDLRLFLDRDDWEVRAVQPFDLFPQTKHLECVVTLRRK